MFTLKGIKLKKVIILDITQVKIFFPNHRKCLVKVLLILVNCILLANSCNLNKAKKKGSIVLQKLVKPSTLYTRFIRFFKMKGKEGFVLGIIQLIMSMALPYLGTEIYHCIAIDRTNWKLGKININILYIGLVLGNGRFIPLYFRLLDKQGNSNQTERIELMESFKSIFSLFTDTLFVLVGDREFIGKQWFIYMLSNSFVFVMRLRKKDYLQDIADQLNISLEKLNKKIKRKVNRYGYCVLPFVIEGKTYYYHVRKRRKGDQNNQGEKDEYIRFLSTSSDHYWVIKQYDRRWSIEVFFEDCKDKGFDLEAINFTQVAKIRLMIAVCALCYILCLIQGMIEYELKTPPKKLDKKRNKWYDRTSVFTKGYELIEQIATQVFGLTKIVIQRINPKYTVNQEVILKNLYAF